MYISYNYSLYGFISYMEDANPFSTPFFIIPSHPKAEKIVRPSEPKATRAYPDAPQERECRDLQNSVGWCIKNGPAKCQEINPAILQGLENKWMAY